MSIDMTQPQAQGMNSSIAPQAPKKKSRLFGCLGVLVAGIIIVIIAISSIAGIHNGLVDQRETVRSGFSDIDTQLQRRADLIPNLVSVTKGYAKHEEKVFTAVSEARSKLLAAKSVNEKAEASAAMNSALGRLMAISESYPQLKANENFIRLQDELAGTENRIAVARTRYNNVVKKFNASIQKFPTSFIASAMNFEPAEYFQPSASQKDLKEAPKVSFE